jgi:hypothetical protein
MFITFYFSHLKLISLPRVHVEDDAYTKAMQTGQRSCPVCRRDIFPDKTFKSTAFEPTEEQLNALKGISGEASTPEVASSSSSSLSDVKGKGKAIANEDAEIEQILQQVDKDDKFEPSAKMLQMMEYIKQCGYSSLLWFDSPVPNHMIGRTSAPDDKIICYSQCEFLFNISFRF